VLAKVFTFVGIAAAVAPIPDSTVVMVIRVTIVGLMGILWLLDYFIKYRQKKRIQRALDNEALHQIHRSPDRRRRLEGHRSGHVQFPMEATESEIVHVQPM